jgi:hypothetical protein
LERAVGRFFDGRIDDPEPVGEKMRRAIEITQVTLKLVSASIMEAERSGCPIENVADFRVVLDDVDKVAAEFKKTWPAANPAMAAASLAAYHRGEYLDSGDLLSAAQSQVSETD